MTNKEKVSGYKIINLNTGEVLTGTSESLSKESGLSRVSVLKLTSGESKIVKCFSLSDDKYEIYDYKLEKHVDKFIKLKEITGLNEISLIRLIQNNHICIKGWSLSKDAIESYREDLGRLKSYVIYHPTSGRTEGGYEELLQLTGLDSSSLNSVLKDKSKSLKGWSLSENNAVFKNHKTLYKLKEGKIISFHGERKELAVKTKLTNYMVSKLINDGDLSYCGWSSNQKTAKKPDQSNKIKLLMSFEGDYKFYNSEDVSDVVEGTIEEVCKKTGTPEESLKNMIRGKVKRSTGLNNSWVFDKDNVKASLVSEYSLSNSQGRCVTGKFKEMSNLLDSELTESSIEILLMNSEAEINDWSRKDCVLYKLDNGAIISASGSIQSMSMKTGIEVNNVKSMMKYADLVVDGWSKTKDLAKSPDGGIGLDDLSVEVIHTIYNSKNGKHTLKGTVKKIAFKLNVTKISVENLIEGNTQRCRGLNVNWVLDKKDIVVDLKVEYTVKNTDGREVTGKPVLLKKMLINELSCLDIENLITTRSRSKKGWSIV